jgi:hypothetical protein
MPFKKQCKSIIPLLWDYESGKLTGDELQRVSAHLQECDSCREQATQYGSVSRMVAEDRNQPVPEFQSTWSHIEKQIAPPPRLRFQPGIVALWASSLLVLFIAVFGLQSLYIPQRTTELSNALESQGLKIEPNITKEQPDNIIKNSPVKTDGIKKPIPNTPQIKRIRPRKSIPAYSLVAKQIQTNATPDVKPEVMPEPDSERYARVVAWGTNPDGTQYQSACTVYEDPETGERRVETTDRSGPESESALLMVSTTGL